MFIFTELDIHCTASTLPSMISAPWQSLDSGHMAFMRKPEIPLSTTCNMSESTCSSRMLTMRRSRDASWIILQMRDWFQAPKICHSEF